MDKNDNDIFVTIITEHIKQNLLEHPGKRFWCGVVMYNSHDYYWEITKKNFSKLMNL